MRRSHRVSVAALLGTVAAVPAVAEEMEQIVVTGSFIRGTPEDAALPVDVMTRQDLEDVGNPTVLEMVRNLGIANGNLGESNQFNASGGQGSVGTTAINLRGLGPARTLVLMNGRRHVAESTRGVDVAAVPSVAISRVEVLKDGAAALYGSDAIAGVVNFITRSEFEGVEFRGSFQDLEGSDGDSSVAGIAGWGNERLHLVGALEFEHRSKLRFIDKDWAVQPIEANPQGGWSSIGNPGTVFPTDGASFDDGSIIGQVADPGCTAVGGVVTGGFCRFQFTQFDNLVEDQDTYRFFAEAGYALTETVELHVEGLYHRMRAEDWNTSPSYPPQSLLGRDRFIAPDHPGLVDFAETFPDALPDGTRGVLSWSRMTGWGGFLGAPQDGRRETDTYRLAAALDGELFEGGLGFDIAVSWSSRDRRSTGPDMYVERMALALDGLAGPDCDPGTGTPGVGPCMYYSPFSTAVRGNSITGEPNPFANPNLVATNEALFPWLVTDLGTDTNYELLVFDATFDGELPLRLGGGPVGWAAGIQSRNEQYTLDPDDVNDLAVNPCPFRNPVSIALGNTDSLDCDAPTGLFAFLSGTFGESTERTVYGAFAEFALPVTDTLDVQLAARFEDYGGEVGSTVDPKLAVRWQVLPSVALRGSVSTTFRGPPQPFLQGRGTSLQFVGAVLAFKAVDTLGNPNLRPETADTANLGIIFDRGGFYGSLDYWRFAFQDPFQVESFNAILGAYESNGCEPGGAGVGTETCALLAQHLVFQPGATGLVSEVQRFEVNWINGSDITTSGVDWLAQYDFELRGAGLLTLGTQGTHTLEYEVDDFRDINGVFLTEGGDFAGNLNDNRNQLTPLVDLQGNLFAKWSLGRHRVTAVVRYWGEYDDPEAIPSLQVIDSMTTVDLTYNVNLLDDALRVNVSAFNLFDEDPPRAQTDLNYDPYTHSAFGRMVKVGLVYQL